MTCGDHGGRTKAGAPCARAARNGGMCALHTGEATPGRAPTESRLSDEDIDRIERAAATVQEDELCHILGFASRTFRDMKRRDPRIAAAYERGRANMKVRLGTTLLNLALGRREVVVEDAAGNRAVHTEEVRPNVTALIFRLKTQDGYREVERREISGPDGGPIRTEEIGEARAQLAARFRALAANGTSRN
jgi:hypothetical protein